MSKLYSLFMSARPGQSEVGRYGEALFESYLRGRNITFQTEPVLAGTAKRIDFVLTPPDTEPVYVEVKTMYSVPFSKGAGTFDPYKAIRYEIHKAMHQFCDLSGTINAVALAVFPGSLVDIGDPNTMLGALYGDVGFRIPLGSAIHQPIERTFLPGRGKVSEKHNTRLSALISVHTADAAFLHAHSCQPTIAQEALALTERAKSDNFPTPYVTVWDSARGKRTIPRGLFEGARDMRWSHDGEAQYRSFVGASREV